MIYYENNDYRLYVGDCLKELRKFEQKSVDMIFADPPYKLSNDGITCKSGKMASVNKGIWDKSEGLKEDHEFNKKWLKACDRVLKDDGTMWISGTYHIIHSIAFALLEMGYYIINEISWVKPNASPNMGCRCFTASQETLLWVKKNKKAKHTFNYTFMKELNGGKQMRSVWRIPTTPKREKLYGKHPTQKPKELLYRCILSSTNEGDIVLDPFCGSGTTGLIAVENNRIFLGIDILAEYVELTKKRICTIEGGIYLKHNNAKPFLKWAGGKTQLLEQFKEYYPSRLKERKITKYIEPFVGGGAVFFYLQAEYDFKEIILNDINEEVILTYRVIQDKVEKLIDFLLKLEKRYLDADMEEKEKIFYEQREAFNQEKDNFDYSTYCDEWVAHAGRMIFLNKTCFNGLYRQNRKGQYNVPFGKRKNVMICDETNLREVNRALQGVKLIFGDFQKLTDYVDENTFVYMDPPYKPLTATSSFNDYSKEPFNDKSQERLAAWVKEVNERKACFMLSNSDPTNINPEEDFFERLYKGFSINKVRASRAINSKGTGRGKLNELLITNENLNNDIIEESVAITL